MAHSLSSRPFACGSEGTILHSGASRPGLLDGRSVGDRMKVHRRHVLAGLVLAAGPGGTAAQTASKVYRVGLLTPTTPLADTSAAPERDEPLGPEARPAGQAQGSSA